MNKISENEDLIISSMFRNKETCGKIISLIPDPETYFVTPHIKELFTTMKTMHDNGLKIEVDSVSTFSSVSTEDIKKIYNSSKEIPFDNIENHVSLLRRNTLEYDLKSSFVRKIGEVLGEDTSVEAKVGALDDIFREVKERNQHGSETFKDMPTLVEDQKKVFDDRKKGSSFFTTGDPRLDALMTYGYAPKDITVVAGRPSNGKSLICLDNARRLANSGNVVALVNLEMKNTQTMDRLLAMNTQIEATRLVKYYSDVSPQEEDKIMREMGRMSKELSFFAIDTPSVSLSDMMSHIKRLQDRIGKEYVVLYIDLFTKLTDFGEAESALDYEKICNKFQKEVKDAGIHAIPIVQINREADKEKITAVEEVSKLYPKVNQIKNAGAFEEIADNVFLVCNPSGYLKKYEWGQYVPSYFRLDVAKQRGGSTSSDDSVILYKNDNTYLSLVTPEDGWNPLTISIDDSKISGYL